MQLYREPGFLMEAVASWIQPPLERTGGAILVCTPEHAEAVRRTLALRGLDAPALESAGRLRFVDAHWLMAQFMVDGRPSAALFKPLVRDVVAHVRPVPHAAVDLRAWGEMVNILWHRGEREAAQELEALWNEVIDEHDMRLLCSYQVDNLAPETHGEILRGICEGHSHLIPEDDYDALDSALCSALVEVYGEQEAGYVRMTLARQRVLATGMPPAQAALVALAERDPETAGRVLAATRAHLLSS